MTDGRILDERDTPAAANRESRQGQPDVRQEDGGLPEGKRALAMTAMVIGNVLSSVDGSMITVALPSVARDLHADPSSTVLVVSAYQLVLLMALLPFSALGDRIGLKRMYQGGQMLFIAGAMLAFLTPNLPFLVGVRVIEAVGAAAMLSVSPAIIRSIFPMTSLGRALSINGMVSSLVGSMAPPLGGLILGVARWPWLFALLVPFGIVSLIIGARALPDRRASKDPYDMKGAAMCAGVFGCAIVGLESAVHGPYRSLSALLVVAAIIGGTFFVRRELRQERPVFPVDLLRRRVIGFAAFSALATFTATMTLLVIIPFRAQTQYHFSPAIAGLILAPWPAMSVIGGPLAGILSDRIPPHYVSTIGMLIALVGSLLLALLPGSPGWVDIAWRMAVAGFGFAMFYGTNARQIVGDAPIARIASAGGLNSTMIGLGRTLGATMVAWLIASGLAVNAGAMFVTTGLCLAAMLTSFLAGPPQPQGAPPTTAPAGG